jgi:hypothetical protein
LNTLRPIICNCLIFIVSRVQYSSMSHFSFRPRDSFEPSVPAARRYSKASSASLSRLLRQLSKNLKQRSSRTGGYSSFENDTRQRCIVKVRYGTGKGSLRAHLSYINREGAGKDGKRPETLGNATRDDITAAAVEKTRHFRMVISPENPQEFPLQLLARKLVQRIEYDTGYSLSWIAAIHENTEHKHLHLVIAGEDAHGQEVKFSRNYISERIREHARDILTEALGDRELPSKEEQLRRQVRANRVTSLDELIQSAGTKNGNVSAASLRAVTTPEKANAALARLQYFQQVGLAKRDGLNYTLSSEWKESLAVARRFASYFDAAKKLKYTPPSLLRLYSSQRDGRIVGRISAIGVIDELSTNNYLLIETIHGQAFYVPLFHRLHAVSVGDTIVLKERSAAGENPGGSEIEAKPKATTQVESMRLIDISFARLSEERLKVELRRLGARRSGFGLHIS